MAMDQMLRKAVFAALIGAITVLTIYEASAAVRFKRFAHCPEGLVSKRLVNATQARQAASISVMPGKIAIRSTVCATSRHEASESISGHSVSRDNYRTPYLAVSFRPHF